MTKDLYDGCAYPVRSDLENAHADVLAWLAAPGTWMSGAHHLAIAAEVRNAQSCSACAELKAALSPNQVKTPHSSLGELSDAEVDVVHRVVADPGRLSERWCRSHIEAGLDEGTYVEMVGVIAMMMIMDTFAFALGLDVLPLPSTVAGEPSRYLPPGAKREAAWVPLVEPGDEVDSDGPLYPSPKAGYIHRALSMVPDTKRAYWALAGQHYLDGARVYDFGNSGRAISRPQIEVIAARVSALHQCLY